MRLLLLLLAACSGTSEPPDDTDTVGDTEETDESDTPAETDPAETEESDPPETDESDPPETDDTDLPVDTTIPPALDGLNLVVNGDGESGDLTGWTLLDNGGDGWAVLQMNAHGGTWAFGTSYGLCRRQQVVDLLEAGFTEAQLDAEPRIDASEWYREHCNGPDPWSIEVALLDSAYNIVASQRFDGTTVGLPVGCDYTDDAWQEVAASFTGYGPGVRYVALRDGGQDVEFWSGQYGVWFDDASIRVSNP